MKKKRSHRGEKIGEEIRRIIGDLLSRELKDPTFDGLVSISYVRATDDGSFATVYFTSLGKGDAEVEAGFEKAKGFIRSEISRKLGIRRAPELRFKADEAERHGQRIDQILVDLDLPENGAVNEIGLEELPDIINAYERYLLFTHVNIDGDSFGSALALADAMREIGREAFIVTGEEPPRTLEFIKAASVIDNTEATRLVEKWENEPFLAIALDFTAEDRLEGREELFASATETLSIDHHDTSKPSCLYNYIDPKAAATSEIIYRFLKSENLPITEKAATALYVGIVTDTGRFQYTNTTPETHSITSELFKAGADFTSSYREIYQNIKAEKLFVQSAMLNTLEIFSDGKAAMAYVKNDTLQKLDAGEDETDGMSELLRSIIGVEVSAFLREIPDGRIKASMRSKEWVDVAALASEFGGGGHKRAAGFTSDLPMDVVFKVVKEKISAALTE